MPDTNSTINLSLSTRITLAFFMSLVAFAIMLGNAVVILAFVVDKKLRHRSSYFFLASESWKDEGSEFILVAYFNMNIYWSLWKCDHLSRCQSHPGLTAVSSNICGHSFRGRLSSRRSLSASTEVPASLHSERQRRKSSLMFSLRTKMNSNTIASKMDSVALHQREHVELLRARRLAKSLAILLGVFAVCWALYSLFTIVLSFYSSATGPKSVWYRIAFWLQWFNSFVNPLLYPLCHKRFQKAFLKIFCIKKQPLPSPHSRSVSS
uniref:Histamine receptor H4 n=1 Tax=Nomascus leucogenys TaxID=61853 RepID=G1R479_NOMLE